MPHVSLITLGVDDVARATAFYEQLGWRRSSASVDGVVSFLDGGTVALAVYGRAALSADSAVEAGASYAMNVAYAAAVDDALDEAAAAGATITKPATATEWGGYIGYFTDLDGHLWEVAHNPGFPLGDEGRVFLPGFQEELARQQEEAEASLTGFIAEADGAGGETVHRLADAVLAELERAQDAIGEVLANVPNNVVLATMLAMSQRSRALPPSSQEYWISSAASTILSGMVGPAEEQS